MGKRLRPSEAPGLQPIGLEEAGWIREIASVEDSLRLGRDRQFGAGLFGDPAWEIVQLLLVEDCAGSSLSFTQMLGRLELSAKILQRYLGVLISRGIIVASLPGADIYTLSRSAREKLLLIFRDAKLASG